MMNKYTNSQKPGGGGGKVRKNNKLGDMNFNSNDLNLLNNLSNLNYLNNHLNANQSNGSLPPVLLNSLSNGLNNLNNLAASNATQFNTSINPQFADQFNKNAITSEFTSQSSMLYPNLPFYQQQSKLTLSSNLNSNSNPPPFAFNPYLTAVLQQSLLNPNLLHNPLFTQPPHLITSDQQQQLFMQQNLNSLTSSLGNLNSLNGLNSNTANNSSLDNSVANGLNYMNYSTDLDLNNISSLNHLNQLKKNLNLLNEKFLAHNLYPPNQIPNNNFNFNFLNSPLTTTSNTPQQTQQPSQHTNNSKCKRAKLEATTCTTITPTTTPIVKEPDHHHRHPKKQDFRADVKEFDFLKDLKRCDLRTEHDFKDNFKCDFKEDGCEDDLTKTKDRVAKFEELKVQTTNDHDKLEDEKKFSPDSSTELNAIIIKEQKNHIHPINCINNQSPIITSTKSSEHSASPDVQLNSSFNSTDQSSKLSNDQFIKREDDLDIVDNMKGKEFVKDKLLNEDSNYETNNCLLKNEDEVSLNIDLDDELSGEENSGDESTNHKPTVDDENLYRLISKKSFQTPTNFKEVSLDRMSFDEDEEDKSPINFNFKNLIDNDLNCSDVKDELTGHKTNIRNKRRLRDNDSNSLNSNPWTIRRSERIFLNEAFNSNSNNCLTLDTKNSDFNLTLKDLEEPQRILLQSDDLLYCGLATKDEISGRICVSLDDVDCAKNNQVFTFDKLIQEAIKEIKVKSIEQLHEDRRVAAFWSPRTRYLYPGRIGKLSDSLNISTTKKDLVLIHFDDGDKTRISMHEIRLLPTDFELKQLDTDEENSSKSSNEPTEEKKVEKLKIKLNNSSTGDQLIKKKKKKHSKERHHKHHHKRHRNHDDQASADEETGENEKTKEEDEEEDNDEWWSKVQTDQLWKWQGKSICSKNISKSKKSKNTFYNAIIRGDEMIQVNDCAVFLSAGRPSLPFIGRIVKMWENANGNMIVNVKWFYHPEETKKPYPKLIDTKGALFESSAHFDDNDVQTISHKVLVLSYKDYLAKKKETKGSEDEDDIYYLSGVYNPYNGQIISIEKDVPMRNRMKKKFC